MEGPHTKSVESSLVLGLLLSRYLCPLKGNVPTDRIGERCSFEVAKRKWKEGSGWYYKARKNWPRQSNADDSMKRMGASEQ